MADVVTVLADVGMQLLSDSSSAALAVRQVVLHDPRSPLEEVPGGVLLLAGLGPAEAAAAAAVRAAAELGYGAVVVKPAGDDPAPLTRLADASGIALLGIPADVRWLQLGSLILTTMGSVGRDPVTEDPAVGDLFGLANAVAAAVGGATAIEDLHQRVLAYSTLPGQPIDPERREGILGRQVPDLPENQAQYRALYRDTGVVRFGADPPGLPRTAIAVRAGAEPLGSIWVVDPQGGLGPDADQALRSAAEIAALHLLRARSDEDLVRQARSEMVRGLLTGDPTSTWTMGRLGMDTEGPFVVIGFGSAQPEWAPEASHRLAGLLALQLESRLGRTASCTIAGTTWLLVSGPRIGSVDRLASLAGEVVRTASSSLRVSLSAAVGSPVSRAEEVPRSWADAERVLELVAVQPDLGPVGTATALSARLALSRLGPLLDDDPGLSSAAGLAVLAHDREHGTPYADVLLGWLDALGDVTACAGRLSVHANTVRYRLRRARELFALDLGDPDQMLVLWLTLRCARSPARLAR